MTVDDSGTRKRRGKVAKGRSMKAANRPAGGRRTGETASRILEAAKDIIALHGVDALRLASISTRLEISVPAIYAHFPNGRQQLVDQVALEGVEVMQEFFPRTGGAPLEELLAGIAGLVRFYSNDRAFLRIMLLDFSSPEGHPSVAREIGKPGPFADGAFSAMYDRLDQILRALVSGGQARPVPASILLNVMLGATALNLIYPPKPRAAKQSIADTVEEIVRDLVCRYLGIVAANSPPKRDHR
jgi:AcrR family transcriptional regulator